MQRGAEFLIEKRVRLRADVLITYVILCHGSPQHLKDISQRHIGARLRLQKGTNIAQNIVSASSA